MIIVLRVFKCPGRHDPPWPDVHDDPVRPGDPGLSHRQRLLQDGLLPDPLWWRPGLHLPLHHQLRERRLPPADCLQYQQGRLCQTERWEDTRTESLLDELKIDLVSNQASSVCWIMFYSRAGGTVKLWHEGHVCRLRADWKGNEGNLVCGEVRL